MFPYRRTMELEEHAIYWTGFAEHCQKRLFCPFVGLLGDFASHARKHKLSWAGPPIAFPGTLEKAKNGTVTAAGLEQNIAGNCAPLKTFQAHTLSREGI